MGRECIKKKKRVEGTRGRAAHERRQRHRRGDAVGAMKRCQRSMEGEARALECAEKKVRMVQTIARIVPLTSEN